MNVDITTLANGGVTATALAAIFGVFQLRVRPSSVVTALRWWKSELRVLGSWLATRGAVTRSSSPREAAVKA